MGFGETIRALRKEHHLSQPEVAETAGITQGYLSDLERGRAKSPSSDVVLGLATALHVSYQELAALVWGAAPDPRPLPVEDLPPFFVALGRRVAPLFTERDWRMVADIVTRIAEEREQERAAFGYQAPAPDQDDKHGGDDDAA